MGIYYRKNYKDGNLEGAYTNYYRIGQIFSIRNYKNNNLEGEYLDYYKNGLLQTKKIINQENLAESIYYIMNMSLKKIQLKVKAFYQNGKLEGEYLEYDEQGRIRGKSFYQNGKLEGEYLYFNNKEIL